MNYKNIRMIIGLTGKIGSGKTTAADYLKTKGFIEYSMAQPLKEIGKIFGFSNEQLYGTQEQKLEIHEKWGISAREFLQKIGTDIFRECVPKVLPNMKMDRTVWVDLFVMKQQKNPHLNYVISDIRFLDEADAILQLGGIIIRVERDNNVSSNSGQEHIHKSETEMYKIPATYVIDNNKLSIEQAKSKLDDILNRSYIPNVTDNRH